MLILLTGASGAGKSTYAKRLAARLSGDLTFISTEIPDGGAIKADPERLRLESFSFAEKFTDIGGLDISGGAAVVDCLCNLTANEMFDEEGNIRKNVASTVTSGVLSLSRRFDALIVITNEIASDGALPEESANAYKNTLCEVNRNLAEKADCVYELCVGVPIVLKGGI